MVNNNNYVCHLNVNVKRKARVSQKVLTEIRAFQLVILFHARILVSFSSYTSYFTDPYVFTSRAARSGYLIFVFRHISHRTFSMTSNPK